MDMVSFELFEIIAIVCVVAVLIVPASIIIYKVLPFRDFGNKKPMFTFFPKYVADFDQPVTEIESALEKLQFKKTNATTYIRGKFWGDISIKKVKLTVEVDEENSKIKVFTPFFAVLFDTGDLWQLTSDIVNGQNP